MSPPVGPPVVDVELIDCDPDDVDRSPATIASTSRRVWPIVIGAAAVMGGAVLAGRGEVSEPEVGASTTTVEAVSTLVPVPTTMAFASLRIEGAEAVLASSNGRNLLVVVDGEAYAVPALGSDTGEIDTLARAPDGIIVHDSDGRVRLVSSRDRDGRPLGAGSGIATTTSADLLWIEVGSASGRAAQLVRITPRMETIRVVGLPSGSRVVSETVDGRLLIRGDDATLSLLDPRDGTTIEVADGVRLLAATAQEVAFIRDEAAGMVLTLHRFADAAGGGATPTESVLLDPIAVPSVLVEPGVSEAAFSPDGRFLAVPVTRGMASYTYVLVDTAGGLQVLDGELTADTAFRFAWISPTGLLVADRYDHLHVVDVSSGRVRRIEVSWR